MCLLLGKGSTDWTWYSDRQNWYDYITDKKFNDYTDFKKRLLDIYLVLSSNLIMNSIDFLNLLLINLLYFKFLDSFYIWTKASVNPVAICNQGEIRHGSN